MGKYSSNLKLQKIKIELLALQPENRNEIASDIDDIINHVEALQQVNAELRNKRKGIHIENLIIHMGENYTPEELVKEIDGKILEVLKNINNGPS